MEIMNKTLTLLFVLLGLMVQVLGHMKTVLILVLGFTVFNVRNLLYYAVVYTELDLSGNVLYFGG